MCIQFRDVMWLSGSQKLFWLGGKEPHNYYTAMILLTIISLGILVEVWLHLFETLNTRGGWLWASSFCIEHKNKFLVLQAIKSAVSLPLPGIEPDSVRRPDRSWVNVLVEFSGGFTKLGKATISFVISVRLSVRMEQLGSHRTDFREIWYLGIFRKTVEKIQVALTCDTNNGHFAWRPIYVFDRISPTSS